MPLVPDKFYKIHLINKYEYVYTSYIDNVFCDYTDYINRNALEYNKMSNMIGSEKIYCHISDKFLINENISFNNDNNNNNIILFNSNSNKNIYNFVNEDMNLPNIKSDNLNEKCNDLLLEMYKIKENILLKNNIVINDKSNSIELDSKDIDFLTIIEEISNKLNISYDNIDNDDVLILCNLIMILQYYFINYNDTIETFMNDIRDNINKNIKLNLAFIDKIRSFNKDLATDDVKEKNNMLIKILDNTNKILYFINDIKKFDNVDIMKYLYFFINNNDHEDLKIKFKYYYNILESTIKIYLHEYYKKNNNLIYLEFEYNESTNEEYKRIKYNNITDNKEEKLQIVKYSTLEKNYERYGGIIKKYILDINNHIFYKYDDDTVILKSIINKHNDKEYYFINLNEKSLNKYYNNNYEYLDIYVEFDIILNIQKKINKITTKYSIWYNKIYENYLIELHTYYLNNEKIKFIIYKVDDENYKIQINNKWDVIINDDKNNFVSWVFELDNAFLIKKIGNYSDYNILFLTLDNYYKSIIYKNYEEYMRTDKEDYDDKNNLNIYLDKEESKKIP